MKIKKKDKREEQIVSKLMELQRRKKMRNEVMEMKDVMEEMSMIMERIVGKDIEIKIDNGRDIWKVKEDMGKLEKVEVKIEVNERDEMKEGGKIKMRKRNIKEEEEEKMN